MAHILRDIFTRDRRRHPRRQATNSGGFFGSMQHRLTDPEANQQFQKQAGMIATSLLLLMMLVFLFIGIWLHPQSIDFATLFQNIQKTRSMTGTLFVLLKWLLGFAYAGLPLLAVFVVFVIGARFVNDVFDLKSFWLGLHHMASAMFGISYPQMVVDEGQIKVKEGKVNLLHALGGPGYALIQPGNLVQFRHLRQLTNASTAKSYFLAHFETVELPISLEDQVGHSESEVYETRDGILVRFKNIRYGYRILPAEEEFHRSPKQPYSYADQALEAFLFDRSVGAEGLRDWQTNIRMSFDGPIREFVSEHSLDFLMAPGIDEMEVRRMIRERVLTAQPLRRVGAEMLWIDIGEIELFQFENEITGQRLERWAADWKGDARVTQAYGEATRRVFLEIGRAEAQAEAIKSIVASLEGVDWKGDEVTKLRRILLSQTSQFLETLLEDQPSKLDCRSQTPPFDGSGEKP